MRVFVLGTGRCGTTTFTMACKCFSNYTATHESTNGKIGNLDFPENHIEAEPGFTFRLPQLIDKYPEALYIHLKRDKVSCVKSLEKRSSLNYYVKFSERMYTENYNSTLVANNYYDFATRTIDLYLKDPAVTSLTIPLVPSFEDWKTFCGILNVNDEEIKESFSKWNIKFNA